MALFVSSVNTDCLCIDKLLCSLLIYTHFLILACLRTMKNSKAEDMKGNALLYYIKCISFSSSHHQFLQLPWKQPSQCLKITQKVSLTTIIIKVRFLFANKTDSQNSIMYIIYAISNEIFLK